MKLGVLFFMMLALSIGETSKLFASEEQQNLPTLKEAIGSKVDLYGNLAISQKNGPSSLRNHGQATEYSVIYKS